jgi:hypothetical protein
MEHERGLSPAHNVIAATTRSKWMVCCDAEHIPNNKIERIGLDLIWSGEAIPFLRV